MILTDYKPKEPQRSSEFEKEFSAAMSFSRKVSDLPSNVRIPEWVLQEVAGALQNCFSARWDSSEDRAVWELGLESVELACVLSATLNTKVLRIDLSEKIFVKVIPCLYYFSRCRN